MTGPQPVLSQSSLASAGWEAAGPAQPHCSAAEPLQGAERALWPCTEGCACRVSCDGPKRGSARPRLCAAAAYGPSRALFTPLCVLVGAALCKALLQICKTALPLPQGLCCSANARLRPLLLSTRVHMETVTIKSPKVRSLRACALLLGSPDQNLPVQGATAEVHLFGAHLTSWKTTDGTVSLRYQLA